MLDMPGYCWEVLEGGKLFHGFLRDRLQQNPWTTQNLATLPRVCAARGCHCTALRWTGRCSSFSHSGTMLRRSTGQSVLILAAILAGSVRLSYQAWHPHTFWHPCAVSLYQSPGCNMQTVPVRGSTNGFVHVLTEQIWRHILRQSSRPVEWESYIRGKRADLEFWCVAYQFTSRRGASRRLRQSF